ncbi:hypothetical protein [Azospirillum canadense]|uniref:hypothetical protein n=1 Tax=Azospirillum canadense TaxID=403962 RepID=UPI002227F04A|nr:hypothetical protein [Azospirillum canadense]MCW2242228.1 hypothetical protein [Azospirillum canadense]
MSAKCPNCGVEFSPEFVTDATKDSRFAMSFHPKDGSLMQAKTIGRSLAALDGLMKAVSKEVGAKSEVLIEKIETAEDGAITAHFLIARNIG